MQNFQKSFLESQQAWNTYHLSIIIILKLFVLIYSRVRWGQFFYGRIDLFLKDS